MKRTTRAVTARFTRSAPFAHPVPPPPQASASAHAPLPSAHTPSPAPPHPHPLTPTHRRHVDPYTATVRSVTPKGRTTRDGSRLEAAATEVLQHGGSVERTLLVTDSRDSSNSATLAVSLAPPRSLWFAAGPREVAVGSAIALRVASGPQSKAGRAPFHNCSLLADHIGAEGQCPLLPPTSCLHLHLPPSRERVATSALI